MQEERFREEIFVNQFSKPQGANPYHLLNSTSIMVSKGIILLVGTKYILKTEVQSAFWIVSLWINKKWLKRPHGSFGHCWIPVIK